MGRQQSNLKFEYYPSPKKEAETAASFFSCPPDRRIRVVDPCCGTGEVRYFTDKLPAKAETWGIELSPPRAEEAREKLDVVYNVDFYWMTGWRWSNESASIIYNNPPYEWNTDKQYMTVTFGGGERATRHEVLFIEKCTDKLVNGGHQVIIIPRPILGNSMYLGDRVDRVARHLLGWYETVKIYRFPDGEYEKFKQVIVFAVKKREQYYHSTKEEIDSIVQLAMPDAPIEVLPIGEGQWEIPEAPPAEQTTFYYRAQNPEEFLRLVNECSPIGTTEYERARYFREPGEPFSPAMPLLRGHLSMLICGQEAGILTLIDEKGIPFLVKGSNVKVSVVTNADDVEDEKGRYKETRVTTVDKFVATISLLYGNGDAKLLQTPKEVLEFQEKFAGIQGDELLNRNKPLYNWNPTPWEWERTGRIALGLKPLPGRKERGLFPAQRHLSVAVRRVLRAIGACFFMGEMGYGKTPSSVAVVTVANRWPVLVMCPKHMLWKWFKSIRDACDPDDVIISRVISRPVSSCKMNQGEDPPLHMSPYMRKTLGEWYYLGDPSQEDRLQAGGVWEQLSATMWKWTPPREVEFENLPERVRILRELRLLGAEDIKAYQDQVQPVFPNDPGQRLVINATCKYDENGLPRIKEKVWSYLQGIKIWETIDANAVEGGKCIKTVVTGKGEHLRAVVPVRDDYTMQMFHDDYKAGVLGKKAVAIISFEQAKYDAGKNNTGRGVYQLIRKSSQPGKGKKGTSKVIYACPECGKEIEGAPDFCSNKIQKEILKEDDKGAKRWVTEDVRCNAPLFNFNRFFRIGLAQLVKRKYKHFFEVYIADEVHKAQAGDTDIGVADQRIISGTRFNLGLTGTLFGGKASSLFHLLYRRNNEVRDLFKAGDETSWVTHFGLRKESWTQQEPVTTGRGVSTNIERKDHRDAELPGVSPAVVRYLLPMTIFAQITDLGYQLPPLYEDVEWVSMGPELGAHYNKVNEDLWEDARIRLLRSDGEDHGGVAIWYSTCRYRPNSAFRDEKTSKDYEMPAVVTPSGWLPKEERLAQMIQHNMSRGRKTLVFVEQSGTKDIRPRITEVLNKLVPRCRVGRLSAASMDPSRREAWIEKNTPNFDVMLVNPKLVETGLDLVMFSDLIFYELTPSLYVLWQSMRRVWRLGQNKDVTCTFLLYLGTIEQDLRMLMGTKMKYAQILYGNEVGGVMLEDQTENDEDLQRKIIEKQIASRTKRQLIDIIPESMESIFGAGKKEGEDVIIETEEEHTEPVVVTAGGFNYDPANAKQLDLFGGSFNVAESTPRRKK